MGKGAATTLYVPGTTDALGSFWALDGTDEIAAANEAREAVKVGFRYGSAELLANERDCRARKGNSNNQVNDVRVATEKQL
jgi:hypothetical protein